LTLIHPETAPGPVELTVSDLERSRRFYLEVIGLEEVAAPEGVWLGAGGGPLLVLHGDPSAPPRPRFSTGLFHMAFLLPDRVELGRFLHRLSDSRWHLDGASDHLVSEALYLSDPDGIGIEVYRDRPRSEWGIGGDGQVAMATLPLDLESIAAEARAGATPKVAAETRMGHVHLNVAGLTAAEAFYGPDGLGFDVTARNYPGALFVSAGGYHHHIGMNTWLGEGAPPPPDGAIGLRRFTLNAPGSDPRDLTDPSGNRLIVRPPEGGAT
jgi:catechol 2,3-dioxygenase